MSNRGPFQLSNPLNLLLFLDQILLESPQDAPVLKILKRMRDKVAILTFANMEHFQRQTIEQDVVSLSKKLNNWLDVQLL